MKPYPHVGASTTEDEDVHELMQSATNELLTEREYRIFKALLEQSALSSDCAYHTESAYLFNRLMNYFCFD